MSKRKAYIIRTPEEMETYSRFSQLILQDMWRAKYQVNMQMVRIYIDKKLKPDEKKAMETAKNDDGFLQGIDARVIDSLYQRAEKELSDVEKAQAVIQVGV